MYDNLFVIHIFHFISFILLPLYMYSVVSWPYVCSLYSLVVIVKKTKQIVIDENKEKDKKSVLLFSVCWASANGWWPWVNVWSDVLRPAVANGWWHWMNLLSVVLKPVGANGSWPWMSMLSARTPCILVLSFGHTIKSQFENNNSCHIQLHFNSGVLENTIYF